MGTIVPEFIKYKIQKRERTTTVESSAAFAMTHASWLMNTGEDDELDFCCIHIYTYNPCLRDEPIENFKHFYTYMHAVFGY